MGMIYDKLNTANSDTLFFDKVEQRESASEKELRMSQFDIAFVFLMLYYHTTSDQWYCYKL
jgi:hypothetical protein